MPVGKDGRIRATFTLNPSTLRTACQKPPLQQLPRPNPKDKDDLANLIRNLVVAAPGHTFYARDFSGIEALLVGYEARAPQYMRLARQDVHSFYTIYGMYELEPGKIRANDLPQLSWDDEKLFARLAEIKKEFGAERNALYKHLVHGANFMQGPKGAAEKIFAETGVEYPTALVGKVMSVYFELFPEIKRWHSEVLYQADRDGYLRNAFGYIHRFSRVYDWEKIGGKWQKSPGPSANMVVAFKAQSTAAAIIKEAMMRLFNDHFEEAGQWLRLLIHDELLFEVPENELEKVDSIVKKEMEAPIQQLALPASYAMGEYLVVGTEKKVGRVWGGMI